MTTSKAPGGRIKDMRGIRRRGGSYQVRVYSGIDPVTSQPVYLTGSATTETAAIKIRNGFRNQVADHKSARTNATLGFLLTEWLGQRENDRTTSDYRYLVEAFISPALGDVSLARLAKTGTHSIEKFYGELRRCRRRCNRKPYVEHRKGCRHGVEPGYVCDKRCKPHACRPLSKSSQRHIHVILNGAFKAAVRWKWLSTNPLEGLAKPKATKPKPHPPSTADAARLVNQAFTMDVDWGTFVWLTMITGGRRTELLFLPFSAVHLRCAVCAASADWHDEKCTGCERDLKEGRLAGLEFRDSTKDDEVRIVGLDALSTEFLVAQRMRYEDRMKTLERPAVADAFIFSYEADHSRPCHPDGITHKFGRMAAGLGIDTHLHALRHYNATDLLVAGVDVKTVAGRLGHADAATTLRFYAAWLQSADEHAAALLAERLTRRGAVPAPRRPADDTIGRNQAAE